MKAAALQNVPKILFKNSLLKRILEHYMGLLKGPAVAWSSGGVPLGKKLSARKVETATKPGKYGDGDNLYLVVEPGGSKRWAFIYRSEGRQREMGLGGASRVSLAMAREKAAEAMAVLGKGDDPLALKKVVNKVPTFGQFCDDHIQAQSPSWKGNATELSWRRSLEHYAAPLRAMTAQDITTDHILSILTPIWSTKAETAQKTQNRLERVLDVAKVRGFRTGENPARWRGHLELLLPRRLSLTHGHRPSMPYENIPRFMARLRSSETSATSALALQFLILTAAREGMVTQARWSEISFKNAVWSVPGARMKARFSDERVDFEVPLSDQAMVVLERVSRLRGPGSGQDAFIFPGQRAGTAMSNATMDALLRRMEQPYVPHGFRSTFRDWAGDETDFPRETAELALAHAVGDKTERAYRRRTAFNKRRELMASWGRYCASMPIEADVSPGL